MFKASSHFKRHRGQGTVEFALALPIFVLAFFAIVEFAHLFYVQLTLRQALRQAGRYMVTGQGQDISDPSNTTARIQAIQARFCKLLIGTGQPCPELTSDPPNGGGPGTTVTITATLNKPWFTVLFNQFAPGGVNLSVKTTWVNYGFVTVA